MSAQEIKNKMHEITSWNPHRRAMFAINLMNSNQNIPKELIEEILTFDDIKIKKLAY